MSDGAIMGLFLLGFALLFGGVHLYFKNKQERVAMKPEKQKLELNEVRIKVHRVLLFGSSDNTNRYHRVAELGRLPMSSEAREWLQGELRRLYGEMHPNVHKSLNPHRR
jgi:hypothetical protein